MVVAYKVVVQGQGALHGDVRWCEQSCSQVLVQRVVLALVVVVGLVPRRGPHHLLFGIDVLVVVAVVLALVVVVVSDDGE